MRKTNFPVERTPKELAYSFQFTFCRQQNAMIFTPLFFKIHVSTRVTTVVRIHLLVDMRSLESSVSVATSCFTLVAISLERYFAICHPLKSRRWQTLSHSYKAIALCWVCSLALSVPIAIHHVYKEILQTGRHACREVWPSVESEQAYTISLNLFLLALPILIMTWAYGCVSYTLWIGMKLEKKTEKDIQCKNGSANYDAQNGVSIYVNNKKVPQQRSGRGGGLYNCSSDTTSSLINSSATNKSNQSLKSSTEPIVASKPFRRFDAHRAMRQSNTERSRAAKKRVIKMLFIIVLEFFIFWTPSYVIYTWFVFDPKHARQHLTLEIKSLFHLLSYVSTCCNPITYCFMNKNFRDSFLMAFRCSKKRYVYANRSQMSMNSGMTNSTRAPVSQAATSYDKIIDSDDISENSF
ncbi:hypothetical protein RRG08_052056 [Elysia crispata]|uniref:G-protein coupled receptors family 1 profile domain-containing protein n=1 Tax=Elysia crispata TaxID=231223 RepID=A0AAE1DS57_9GAST|nr:hypothetical protein RRG08_052056 [Elysia crispata]